MKKTNNKIGILLPPAVGYSIKILFNLFFSNKISSKYYPRAIVITVINLINLPFRSYERSFINPRFKEVELKKPPIFIIGHWRSGTTHLHNLLCQDKQMGYTTTYQSVFPDTMFNVTGRFLFENFTQLLIPGKRQGDNVKLDARYPQEEEFSLGDKTPISFYYFWLFPREIMKYYLKYVRLQGITIDEKSQWKEDYKLLIKKALKNTNGSQFLSKNPTNTARIKILLEMYPDAKFIHIHRNPIEVYLSTRNFFQNMMPHLQLQTIEPEIVEKQIVSLYKDLMSDYFQQENDIPKENLINVSFDELENNPGLTLKKIYDTLGLEGYKEANQNFTEYINLMDDYKKNKHIIYRSQLSMIENEFGFAMDKLKYNIPSNLEIREDK